MCTVPEVPAALRQTHARWEENGRPPQEPMRWNLATWSKWMDTDLLPSQTLSIDRAGATSVAASAVDGEDAALRAFVTAMIWGYGPIGYGGWRTQRVLNLAGHRAGALFREVAEVAAEKGPRDAYAAMAQAPLTYLGEAFGTKYIYFCTAAVRDRHRDRTAPVLDNVVRHWFARHTGIRMSGAWSTREYFGYLDCLESWGDELGVPSDTVEELIFRSQVSDDGNRLWAEPAMITSDPQGEAVVALDELRAAIDVLGEDTAARASSALTELSEIINDR
ncbi:hypothetical protein WIS52_25830 [Pseudonocardia nematodicida]|uniref:Propane 2-monooxygenase n=1 Tax=Pseudonocardia nematodicida TaxID=1206997 RepID=A0ABV1KJ00_9PSEU